MLNPKDREAIEGLFWRLNETERNADPRDREAEALIARRIAEQPAAPYYMAQTILVQETALKMAEERIAQLEREGGQQARQPARQRGPWDRNEGYDDRRGGGGGFLAGAAQTALGVTGGILIGSAIASILSGAATAGEWGQSESSAAADQPPEDTNADTDAGNDDVGGSDWGDDGGGFDVGGDF